jgi:regulator of cell morphogenesis and NO signaling
MENLTRPHQLHKDHLTEDMTLAKIALRADPYAAVLGRHDLDFCCHGGRTLAQACAETGLEVQLVLAELRGEAAARAAAIAIEIDWNHRPLPELVDFIVDTHHAFTRAAIARITPLLTKVTGKHARRHPELLRIAESFGELAADMGPHMVREERVLFPYIRALASPAGAPSPTFVTVRNPVGMMMQEHDRAGELLAEISAATGDCAPPADACASFRALYAALAELRLDLMKHVALENSILFPRAVALEDQQLALATGSA